MILDRLEHWQQYMGGGTLLAKGFRYLESFDSSTEDGRYEIEGDRCFALVQSYPTRSPEQCRFEAHQKYIDIQYLVSGSEGIGWSPVDVLQVSEEYHDDKDVAFYTDPLMPTLLLVQAGQFAVFYPGDGHAPGIALPDSDHVRKVVVKVRVEE